MATNKFVNIISDMLESKLKGCYKKYANKNEENLPSLFSNLSYYPKDVKTLIEKRDQNCVDELTELLLDVLKNQSSSSENEDKKICYYSFKNQYGDSRSRSSLGQIYNNISHGYINGVGSPIKNDGGSLITKILNKARDTGFLPMDGVSYIATLMGRAKLIAGRKPEDMTKEELKISNKMFNSVVLDMKITFDNGGEEPRVGTYDYDGCIFLGKLSESIRPRIFDYHGFNGTENRNLDDKTVNHYGVEGELDFGTQVNFYKSIRDLTNAGIMFDADHERFNIIPMYDGSICGSFGVEIIFAADTFEGITYKLEKAKAIFNKYGVKSSTEKNHTGIHITQDFDYLKGNAFYNLCKYVNEDMPMSEYMQITKRAPNGYCCRMATNRYPWVEDGNNHILNTERAECMTRYASLNVTNVRTNRLEGRMFNSCCDPVECIRGIQYLNEKFNSISNVEVNGKAGA